MTLSYVPVQYALPGNTWYVPGMYRQSQSESHSSRLLLYSPREVCIEKSTYKSVLEGEVATEQHGRMSKHSMPASASAREATEMAHPTTPAQPHATGAHIKLRLSKK